MVITVYGGRRVRQHAFDYAFFPSTVFLPGVKPVVQPVKQDFQMGEIMGLKRRIGEERGGILSDDSVLLILNTLGRSEEGVQDL